MGLLDRLTGKDKKKAEQQKAETAATSLLNAPPPYPTQQIAPQPQESNDDDLYSGFGAEDVAAPLATEDLEYDEGFQVNDFHFFFGNFVDFNNNVYFRQIFVHLCTHEHRISLTLII